MENEIQVMTFDRSDPNEVVAIRPGKKPIKITRLQDLKQGGMVRTDIAMVNLWRDGDCIRQLCVYATPDGLIGDALEFMTKKELAECEAIRQRLIEASKQHPEMRIYLNQAY